MTRSSRHAYPADEWRCLDADTPAFDFGCATVHTGAARIGRSLRAIPFATRSHPQEPILMNRRHVLCAAGALLVAPALRAADEPSHVPFSQDAYEQALASGEPFVLDFYASW